MSGSLERLTNFHDAGFWRFLTGNRVGWVLSAQERLRALPGDSKGLYEHRTLIQAGIVLLVAELQAFVEELFESAMTEMFWAYPESKRKMLVKRSRINNPDVDQIEGLFFKIGIPWVLTNVRWPGASTERIKKELNLLVRARHRIAHGTAEGPWHPGTRLNQLRRWEKLVERLMAGLARQVTTHVENYVHRHGVRT